jgi:hypothetical protein
VDEVPLTVPIDGVAGLRSRIVIHWMFHKRVISDETGLASSTRYTDSGAKSDKDGQTRAGVSLCRHPHIGGGKRANPDRRSYGDGYDAS